MHELVLLKFAAALTADGVCAIASKYDTKAPAAEPQENLNFGFVRIVTRGCAFVIITFHKKVEQTKRCGGCHWMAHPWQDPGRAGPYDSLRQFVRLLMRYLRRILLYILKKIPLREVLVF